MYRNPEREAEVFKYWKEGHYTIDQISTSTSIPRSTVGYYTKKFSRKNPRDDRQNVTRPSMGRNKFKGFAIETRELILTSAIEMFSQKKYGGSILRTKTA